MRTGRGEKTKGLLVHGGAALVPVVGHALLHAAGLAVGALLVVLVVGEGGELLGRLGGLDLGRLHAHGQAGDLVVVDALAARLHHLPLQVLLQVGQHDLAVQALDLAALQLVVEGGVEGHVRADQRAAVHARGGEGRVRAQAVGVGAPGRGLVALGLAEEEVDVVGAAERVALGDDVGGEVVVVRGRGVGEALGRAGAGRGVDLRAQVRGALVAAADDGEGHGVALALGVPRCVQVVDLGADAAGRGVAAAELRVGVPEVADVPHGVRGVEGAPGVAVERPQSWAQGGSVSSSTSLPGVRELTGVGVHLLARTEGVGGLTRRGVDVVRRGVDRLPQSVDAVDVGVVHPENRVEGSVPQDGHVAVGAADVVVDVVVDSLERLAAHVGVGVAEPAVVGAVGEQLVDALTQRRVVLVDTRGRQVVLGQDARGVGGVGVTHGHWPRVPWAREEARAVERVGVVPEQRVEHVLTARRGVEGHEPVGDGRWEAQRYRRSPRPSP